ncbi:NUDIX hydrolase [Streptomyces sp. NPDC006475]|uniref:NUDIX hydrolase n=1 Tax=Streptomyces sp. NPDC006475 TaxID=3155719 RepID=UPI0033B5EBE4
MSSSLSPSARVASQSVPSAAQYAATRHAVWLGAAAITTDQVGHVLLVHPTYHEDDRWLLPGGVVEPATGRPFARLLATPAQAAALLGWGPPGARQARLAAETARERWGLPAAGPTAIEEVPAEGMQLG